MVGKNEEAALISGGFFDAQLSAKAVFADRLFIKFRIQLFEFIEDLAN